MIAMQYCFTLPADYDMDIIRTRIEQKGHLTDKLPMLVFKAFLYALKNQHPQQENQYAPFYVWQDSEGMNQFLAGPGFKALVNSFGWPVIKTWSVLLSQMQPTLDKAAYATQEIISITPYTDLEILRKKTLEDEQKLIRNTNNVATVIAFEPTTWTQTRLQLWSDNNTTSAAHKKYCVGHMSIPQR